MGSIDTFTDPVSSEASSTVVPAIEDEPNGNEDLGDSSDEEPPFPFASRGKVVCPIAGNNLRSNTNGVRSSKQIRDAKAVKSKEGSNDLDKRDEGKKTK